ncbi:transposable element Tcb1 transposase [Trichonephila clavipes]|nr:transposable element Tcb1 transposase [Trichonephila clavipes]
MKEGCGRQNGMKLSLLMSHASVCNTTMVGFESGDTVESGERILNSCVIHRHNGSAPSIMVWGGIGYHSRTPLVRIAGTLNSWRYISEVLGPVVLPYLQGLASAIFQQDNARPHVARIVQRFFVNHRIKLLPWLARSPNLSPIENMWPMVAQRLTQITPPASTPDQLRQHMEAAWSAVP